MEMPASRSELNSRRDRWSRQANNSGMPHANATRRGIACDGKPDVPALPIANRRIR